MRYLSMAQIMWEFWKALLYGMYAMHIGLVNTLEILM